VTHKPARDTWCGRLEDADAGPALVTTRAIATRA
jgi:hypothetical protein